MAENCSQEVAGVEVVGKVVGVEVARKFVGSYVRKAHQKEMLS